MCWPVLDGIKHIVCSSSLNYFYNFGHCLLCLLKIYAICFLAITATATTTTPTTVPVLFMRDVLILIMVLVYLPVLLVLILMIPLALLSVIVFPLHICFVFHLIVVLDILLLPLLFHHCLYRAITVELVYTINR